MQKTGTSADTPRSTRTKIPKASTPRKKSSSQKALMGHKWFKGSPKSKTQQRMSKKLLKSSPIEKTPSEPVIPPQVVEFNELGGTPERLSVFDPIHILDPDKDEILKTAGALFNFDIKQEHPSTSFLSPAPLMTPDGSKKVKGSVKSGKARVKSTGKQKNGKTPNTKTPDVEGRKKSWTCLTKLPEASYRIIEDYVEIEAPPKPNAYIRYMERLHEELADEVEYDLDEEDCAWLDLVNDKRKEQNFLPVRFEDMELLMDRLEKESYFQMQSTGIDQGALIDDDAVCCICMDGECQNSNAILFCDMCNLAVHQECYGVPYIPEGQWLCRRCLQSPSRAVDCALCPNKGGAFKQTDNGRWAHVVCAIWIPEVCFANTVFLEPVDSIGNIPPARWRLVCYICKQKGVGACIQCHKGNCYTAFHVTCAQQAGLCMKMDTVRESSSITVKKTAFCDHHAPPESDFFKDVDGTPSPRQKMRQTRKLLAEKRSAIPVLSIPTIPHDRIAEITSTVNFSRKNQFIKRLMAYWKLKRQLRNGVPLLRRLQAASSIPHRDTSGQPIDPSQVAENQEHYRYWLRLRQDLERARLLCELVRKREKVKRDLIHLKSREVEIKLKPFSLLLMNVLEEIQAKDVQQIFANPVDTSEVPDYLDVVEKPMDFSTITEKINSFEYNNVEEFEADFNLMIDNCLNYNSKDTVFYRTGVRLREIGGIIIRYARRSINSIGFDPATGLHLPERTHVPVVLTDEEILQKVENLLNDENRFEMPFDKHLELLHEMLDDTLALSHSATRKKKFNRVKQEIIRVRRLKHSKNSQLNKLSSKSPIKKKYNRTRSHTSHSEEEDTRNSSPEVSNRRARSKKSKTNEKEQSSNEQSTQRTLRPMKRKLSEATSLNENSRLTVNKLTTTATSTKPSAKKSRRISSSASNSTTTSFTTTTPGMSTPLKSRGNQAVTTTSPEWKKALSFSPDSTSSKLSTTLRDRDTIRLRDREQHTEKTATLQQPSKSSKKAATSAQPLSGVGRRSAILFTKKGNSTPTKNPHSSPNKSRSSPLNQNVNSNTLPKNVETNSLSPSSSKTNNVKSVPKKSAGRKPNSRVSFKSTDNPLPIEPEVRKGRNPPRRNSAQKKFCTKANTVNSATNNNNVMNDNNSHHNSLLSNINSLHKGAEPIFSTSSSPSKVYSGKVCQLTNTNLTNSSVNSTTSSNSNSKRKKKASKNNPSATLNSANNNNNSIVTSNFGGENNVSGSANVDGSGNVLNNFQPCGRIMNLNSSNNNSKNNKGDNHNKSDSFMVYRSGGRDMDSNSEDDDDTKNGCKEEDEVPESDDSDDDDEGSVDGSQESSSDDSSSGCSNAKNSTSKSASSESEVESEGSDSDNRVVRLNSHQTRNDNNKVGRKKIQCRQVHQNSNINDDEEEEGLVKDDVNLMKVRLQPLDLVWAMCKEGFWYPALIVNPDMPQGFTQNQVHIPGPPNEILNKRPRASNESFLVLCFDTKRTWEWTTRSHLQPLGQNAQIDKEHLDTVRKTGKTDRRSDKRALRKAYEKAILHRHRVTAGNNDETCREFHSIQNESGWQECSVIPEDDVDTHIIPASDDQNNNLHVSKSSKVNQEELFETVNHQSIVPSSSSFCKYVLRSKKYHCPQVPMKSAKKQVPKLPKHILNKGTNKSLHSVPSSLLKTSLEISRRTSSRRAGLRINKSMIKKCECCE